MDILFAMAIDPSNVSKLGPLQFSLRTLLVAVAFLAVSCLALARPSGLWLGVFSTATVMRRLRL